MRGRLINKFVLVLKQLDTLETGAVSSGGYDDEFGEVLAVDDGSQMGSTSRREKDVLRIDCQLDRSNWESDNVRQGGHEKIIDNIIILHMVDLEEMDLIDSNGDPKIYIGDRIDSIEKEDGDLQFSFEDLYVKGIEKAGFGLSAFGLSEANLIYLHCSNERKQ